MITSFKISIVLSYSFFVVNTVIAKLSAFADGTTLIPLSSKNCASSTDEYFFVPLVRTDAVKSAVPGIVSVNSPPLEKMLIATISLTLFGVSKRVAPLESSYFCVFSFSLINLAGCSVFVIFEILTSLLVSGKTIDTALLSFPRYLIATRFTSSAVTFFMLSRYVS